MIGDTIATSDLHTWTGDLPDAVSHITTLTKVNQDNYGSEYRLRGDSYDYSLKLRNSVESLQKDGTQNTRHNAEFTVSQRSGDPTVPDTKYIVSITARFPKGADADILRAVAGHIGQIITFVDNGSVLQKMLNFES